ncbi:MAG: TrmB family transcriptional regulator [Dactylosporangium sp.]|jgi:DNA-binding MarR family transcriptional regulator|nr:TrmB family transcriptional regulator [Dactylosporangium sp.]
MVPKPRLFDELTDLGLTQYEARTYLALVGRDRYTAAELARASGVPRQRIYDVLGSLTERGVVRTRAGQVVRYLAVDPAVAVNRLMAAHRAEFERIEQTSMRLVDALVPLWSTGRGETDPLDYVDVIRDPDALRTCFEEMQSGAKHQLLTLSKMPYLVVDNPVGLRTARRLARVGGDVRCVYEYPMLRESAYVTMTKRFVAAGERARLADAVPMRLCIVDGARVLMSLRDPVADGVSTTTVHIEHPAVAECLTYAFETLWSRADDFASALDTRDRVSAPSR